MARPPKKSKSSSRIGGFKNAVPIDPDVVCQIIRARYAPYKGYRIKHANPTGGKAGKGCNKTSTIQVMDGSGRMLLKSVRYRVNDPKSRSEAVRKACE